MEKWKADFSSSLMMVCVVWVCFCYTVYNKILLHLFHLNFSNIPNPTYAHIESEINTFLFIFFYYYYNFPGFFLF